MSQPQDQLSPNFTLTDLTRSSTAARLRLDKTTRDVRRIQGNAEGSDRTARSAAVKLGAATLSTTKLTHFGQIWRKSQCLLEVG